MSFCAPFESRCVLTTEKVTLQVLPEVLRKHLLHQETTNNFIENKRIACFTAMPPWLQLPHPPPDYSVLHADCPTLPLITL